MEDEFTIDQSLLNELRGDQAAITTDDTFKPKEGKSYTVRILPGAFGASGRKFFLSLYQHWTPDPESDSDIPFLCLDRQEFRGQKINAKCPFCQKWEEAERNSDAKRGFAFRQSWLMNVLHNGKVLKWFAPKTAFEPILEAYVNHANNSQVNILHPMSGYNFQVSMAKNDRDFTEYNVVLGDTGPIASSPAEIQAILASAENLEELISTQFQEAYPKTESAIQSVMNAVLSGRYRSNQGRRGQNELSGNRGGGIAGLQFRIPGMAAPASTHMQMPMVTIPSAMPTIPSTMPTIPSAMPTIPSAMPTIPSAMPTVPTMPTIPSAMPTVPTMPTMPTTPSAPPTVPTTPSAPPTVPTTPSAPPTVPTTPAALPTSTSGISPTTGDEILDQLKALTQ